MYTYKTLEAPQQRLDVLTFATGKTEDELAKIPGVKINGNWVTMQNPKVPDLEYEQVEKLFELAPIDGRTQLTAVAQQRANLSRTELQKIDDTMREWKENDPVYQGLQKAFDEADTWASKEGGFHATVGISSAVLGGITTASGALSTLAALAVKGTAVALGPAALTLIGGGALLAWGIKRIIKVRNDVPFHFQAKADAIETQMILRADSFRQHLIEETLQRRPAGKGFDVVV